jgi:prevent-host-death family protein
MQQVNIAEAKARRSELVRKALDGEDVIIVRNNTPLVKLVPVSRTVRRRHPGSAKGQVIMSKNFSALLDEMKGYC